MTVDNNCYLCKIKFDCHNKLDLHIKTVHLRMFVCPRCPNFSSLIKVRFNQHLLKSHNATETAQSITLYDETLVEMDKLGTSPNAESRSKFKTETRSKPKTKTSHSPNSNTSFDAEKVKGTSPKANIDSFKDATTNKDILDNSLDSTFPETSSFNLSEATADISIMDSSDSTSYDISTNNGSKGNISEDTVDEDTDKEKVTTPMTASRLPKARTSIYTRSGPSSRTARSSQSTSLSTSFDESSLVDKPSFAETSRLECDHCWFTTESKTEFETHEKTKHAFVF